MLSLIGIKIFYLGIGINIFFTGPLVNKFVIVDINLRNTNTSQLHRSYNFYQFSKQIYSTKSAIILMPVSIKDN